MMGSVGEYLCAIPIGRAKRNNMINEDLRPKSEFCQQAPENKLEMLHFVMYKELSKDSLTERRQSKKICK